MDRVRCAGSENLLIDCPHNRSHSCTHAEDAAVHCQTSKEYRSNIMHVCRTA